MALLEDGKSGRSHDRRWPLPLVRNGDTLEQVQLIEHFA